VILAMGAGRQAASSMKAYLGILDTDSVYRSAGEEDGGEIFGIGDGQKNFARVRIAPAP
jgi:glutamate synthase (NADPH/NADH) small chain